LKLQLQNDFLPQLTANGLPLQTQQFMQDGATQHTANVVLDFWNTVFGPRVMSKRYLNRHKCGNSWPALISDLNPCGSSWGFLKKKLFPNGPETTGKLVELYRRIEEDTCRRVRNTRRRLQEVTRVSGGHMEHTLTQKNYIHREHIHFFL